MRHWLPLIFGLALVQSAMAQDLRDTLFEETDLALEAARNANASLLSPRLFEDGLEAYVAAENDLERGRNLDRIRNRLNTATTAFTNAAEASEIAEITLASLIKTRDDAIQALADCRVAISVPPILRRLETEQDEFVRGVILRGLKRLEG